MAASAVQVGAMPGLPHISTAYVLTGIFSVGQRLWSVVCPWAPSAAAVNSWEVVAPPAGPHSCKHPLALHGLLSPQLLSHGASQ